MVPVQIECLRDMHGHGACSSLGVWGILGSLRLKFSWSGALHQQ